MRLVFLYGPPGAGKLTVARELVTLTGMKLFHNHLTVDPVVAVFPWGSPSLSRLITLFRREVLAEAARVGTDVIFTYVYGHPEDDANVREIIDPVIANGGIVHFVQVACSRDILLSRVAEESRRPFGKLTNPDIVAAMMDREDLVSPLSFGESLRIDTTALSPREAATAIVAHFDVPTIR